MKFYVLNKYIANSVGAALFDHFYINNFNQTDLLAATADQSMLNYVQTLWR